MCVCVCVCVCACVCGEARVDSCVYVREISRSLGEMIVLLQWGDDAQVHWFVLSEIWKNHNQHYLWTLPVVSATQD